MMLLYKTKSVNPWCPITKCLADGTTVQALVPQVYVRLQQGDLNTSGALLAGVNIQLNTSGDAATGADGTLTNSGSIAGRSIVTISADTIDVIGGSIQAGTNNRGQTRIL
jgi:filamentous hemagglutinin